MNVGVQLQVEFLLECSARTAIRVLVQGLMSLRSAFMPLMLDIVFRAVLEQLR